MKNTKTCPKCGRHNIILVPGNVGAYGSGNNITTGMTIFSSVPVDRYICEDCGYSEEWIAKENIPKIQKKFSKE